MDNPYREGSKMNRIYQFMSDGNGHTLPSIIAVAYPGRAVCPSRLARRRTASALRTMRKLPNVVLKYYAAEDRYCMTIRTAAAAGSSPSGDRSSRG